MRYSGIVLPIFSLPTEYGIGTLGQDAREFIDFLVSAGTSIWEIMPINHTDLSGCPHRALSVFAGNPLLIDLQPFINSGILSKKELSKLDWGKDRAKVNYQRVARVKYQVLEQVYHARTAEDEERFLAFCAENDSWLQDYALFVALKEYYDWLPHAQWKEELRVHDPAAVAVYAEMLENRISFWKYLQYLFYTQWEELHHYATVRGVKLMGSAAYFTIADSAERWANPSLTQIEQAQGGEESCRWWNQRLDWGMQQYDIFKIYHRHEQEDLFLFYPNSVGGDAKAFCTLLRDTDFTNDFGSFAQFTHAFQKAFGGDRRRHMPHFFVKEDIAYLGTCSDDTIRGWMKTLSKEQLQDFAEYVGAVLPRDQAWSALHTLWKSGAGIVLAPIQDFLELGSSARLSGFENEADNWTWRLRKGSLNNRLAQRIARMNRLVDRV